VPELVDHSGILAACSGRDGALLQTADKVLIIDGVSALEGERKALNSALLGPDGGRTWREVSESYAVCVFDRKSRELTLARDRFGTRPVFYAQEDGSVFVASECKILQALGIDLEIHPQALWESLVYRWVIGENHIFDPVRQVPRGGVVIWRPGQPFSAHDRLPALFSPSPATPDGPVEYVEKLDQALRLYFRDLNERYPRVGLLLSGGVDSSLLAAIGREELRSLHAYVGRIPGSPNPEVERALTVARMLDIPCHVVDIDTHRFASDLPYIVRRLEELPRHPNNLVLNQLYERMGQEVDVVLQGDGSGTLFGHFQAIKVARFAQKAAKVKAVPVGLRTSLAKFLENCPGKLCWRVARVLAWDPGNFARFLEAIEYNRDVRRSMGLSLLQKDRWESGEWNESIPIDDAIQSFMIGNLERASLVRHDRLAQPFGLTSLSPFFSEPVFGVAERMPREYRNMGTSKTVIRNLLGRYVPPEVLGWEKMGFSVPWRQWLAGELSGLRSEASGYLRNTRYLPSGFWDASEIGNDGEAIWTGLCLFLLLREFDLALEA
jgi:asparagine synthase (glutamine-hydrolysing)